MDTVLIVLIGYVIYYSDVKSAMENV